MRISLTAHQFLPADTATAFDFTNDARNFVSFVGFGIVPGIREARYETPGAPRLFSRRRITKTDGTNHIEEITAGRGRVSIGRLRSSSLRRCWLRSRYC